MTAPRDARWHRRQRSCRRRFLYQFAFTVVGPYFPGTHTRVDFDLACTAASSVVGLRLNVTGQPVGGATGSQGGGTAATGAVPVGAPNTGSGPQPGSDRPMMLGGVALLLLGGGGAVYATFAVDGVQKVVKSTFPTEAIYGNASYPSLRLATCGGPGAGSLGR